MFPLIGYSPCLTLAALRRRESLMWPLLRALSLRLLPGVQPSHLAGDQCRNLAALLVALHGPNIDLEKERKRSLRDLSTRRPAWPCLALWKECGEGGWVQAETYGAELLGGHLRRRHGQEYSDTVSPRQDSAIDTAQRRQYYLDDDLTLQ